MKFAGFLLLAAGFAFSFHAYSTTRFHDLPAIAPEASQMTPGGEAPRLSVARNFAVATAPTPTPSVTAEVASAAPAVVAALPAMPTASVAAVTSSEDPRDRTALVRRIQRELRRVGCYGGRIDGEWDRTLRASMAQFVERVNATLPYQEPDVVLLTLVRNHKAVACGSGCPTGQSVDGSGRCVPDAIVAKAQRKPSTVAHAQAPHDSGWKTTVTVAEMRPSAATLPPPSPPKATATHAARPAPLPGRMAVGASVEGATAPQGKGWWESFITPSSGGPATREETLDRPVGLTHVPEPRLVRRDAVQLSSISQQPVGAADGASDGPALVPANTNLTAAPIQAKAGKSYRKASRSKSRAKYASRSRGRNVQALFQHPLGRM